MFCHFHAQRSKLHCIPVKTSSAHSTRAKFVWHTGSRRQWFRFSVFPFFRFSGRPARAKRHRVLCVTTRLKCIILWGNIIAEACLCALTSQSINYHRSDTKVSWVNFIYLFHLFVALYLFLSSLACGAFHAARESNAKLMTIFIVWLLRMCVCVCSCFLSFQRSSLKKTQNITNHLNGQRDKHRASITRCQRQSVAKWRCTCVPLRRFTYFVAVWVSRT